mgnify:FL=1|jgi:hypothetical protein|tara:strand:+ start:45 stop:341 length:297 start_codon:yes stop_codon:yes gene_type:complete
MKKKWNDFRKQYAGIIQNLMNNVDICNRRYVEQGEEGYLVQRDVYIKEIEELKTFIKTREAELGYYSNDEVDPESTTLFDLHNLKKNKNKSDDFNYLC